MKPQTKARDLWDCEPVALAEAVRGAAEKALVLTVLFGAPLTPEQVAGIIGVLGSIFGVLMIVVRNKVSPTAASPIRKDPHA